jgi:hypothetical protein
MDVKRFVAAALTLLATVVATGASSGLARTARARFMVTSTLDGKKVLPHRILWIAHPKLPRAQVQEVDFLVDGKKLWVEHNPPYTYGDDGNYLVTSFLAPGTHRFTVKAVSTRGTSALDRVIARVLPAPKPPAGLAGTWKSYHPKGGVPAGTWELVVDKIGWRIDDPAGGGNLLDVAYLSPGLAEVRTGIATGHKGHDLNGWCDDRPGSPVRMKWTVTAEGLRFTYAGGKGCPGFVDFLGEATWTRAK